MKKYAVLLLFGLLTGAAFAASQRPGAEEFLRQVRRPRAVESYAVLQGTVLHRRAGAKVESSPIRLGTINRADRILAQLVLGGNESYTIGQTFVDPVSTIEPGRPGGYAHPLLGRFGLRASDLAMTFLFWPFKMELSGETSRTVKCRIFELSSPQNDEIARVWIAEAYGFPMKALFFRGGEKTPYRELAANSFKKQGDFYVIDELALHGPGWRTRVKFHDIKTGILKPGTLNDIFVKLP